MIVLTYVFFLILGALIVSLYFLSDRYKKTKLNQFKSRTDLRAFIIVLIFAIIGVFFCILAWNKINFGITGHDEFIEHILRDIGLIFIAIALVDFILKYFMHAHFRQEIIEEIKLIVPLYRSQEIYGIQEIESKLPRISDLFSTAKKIVIVQTFIPNLESYKTVIVKALSQKKEVSLDIYLLSPNSKMTSARSNVIIETPESNKNTEKIKNDTIENKVKTEIERNRTSLMEMYEMIEKINKKHTIRLRYFEYDLIPSASIYKFDDFAYVGYYVYGSRTIDTPQLKVDWNKEIGNTYEKHLDYLMSYPEKVKEIDLSTGLPK